MANKLKLQREFLPMIALSCCTSQSTKPSVILGISQDALMLGCYLIQWEFGSLGGILRPLARFSFCSGYIYSGDVLDDLEKLKVAGLVENEKMDSGNVWYRTLRAGVFWNTYHAAVREKYKAIKEIMFPLAGYKHKLILIMTKQLKDSFNKNTNPSRLPTPRYSDQWRDQDRKSTGYVSEEKLSDLMQFLDRNTYGYGRQHAVFTGIVESTPKVNHD